jgi:tryptophan-rich sensory protein
MKRGVTVTLARVWCIWIAAVVTGILGNIALHRYRISLYNRNTDYPPFHSLQRLQYELFWTTVAVMVTGAAWVVWLKLRRR